MGDPRNSAACLDAGADGHTTRRSVLEVAAPTFGSLAGRRLGAAGVTVTAA